MTNWPRKYLKEIQAGNVTVSEKVKIVYEREIRFMNDPPKDDDSWHGWKFSPKEAQRHIDFIEKFCKQSKGRDGGKALKLMLWQKAFLSLIFGWVNSKGERRFREIFLLVGRKNGKTEICAALTHDLMLNDKEAGPEIYCAANARDQAKILFDEAVNMRSQSAALRSVEKKRQSDIYCPTNFGKIKALAAKTDNLDGLNASAVFQDEIHEQKTSSLYDVLKQSQSFRDQPLYFLITTNGFQREGFFDSKYTEMSNAALWNEGFQDYTILPIIYELDHRDEWNDETKWEKANPGLGVIKKMETLRQHVEQAKRDPSFFPTLMTKDFNLPENSAEGWLTFEETINEQPLDMDYLRESYAIGGCDLSATTDLTAATILVKKPGDENLYVLQKYFLPQKRIDEIEDGGSTKEAPYQKWAEQGWLKICDGATVNYHDVTSWFVSVVREYNIRPLWVCYDAALSGYWREEMEETGFEMEKIRQGPFTWTYPMKRLKGEFAEHKIIYDNNPMLRWCLLNTGIKTTNADGITSIQPVKTAKNKRIDGMVSLLNAYVGYCNHEEEFIRYIK